MKRFLYSLFLVLLSVVALTSCENDEDVSYDKLIGTWVAWGTGSDSYMQFRDDGTCYTVDIVDGYPEVEKMDWSLAGKMIILDVDFPIWMEIVSLSNSKMELRMLGFVTPYRRVPDSVIEQYLKEE